MELRIASDQFGNRPWKICHHRQRSACVARTLADFAGELIAPTHHGVDEPLLPPEYPAQRGNLYLQVVVFHDPARPGAADKFLLTENGAARLDQRDEQVEGAAAEIHFRTVGEKFTAQRKDRETTELEARGFSGLQSHGMRIEKAYSGIEEKPGNLQRQSNETSCC